MLRAEEIILEYSTTNKKVRFLSSLSDSDLEICIDFFKIGWHINWRKTFESELINRKIKKRNNNIKKII